MAKGKAQSNSNSAYLRPALTPEAEENQMIALATDAAKKKLMDGTAPAQIIVHYLKLGTSIAQLEKTRLEAEIEERKAKAQKYERDDENRSLYLEALEAMRKYSGNGGATNGDY